MLVCVTGRLVFLWQNFFKQISKLLISPTNKPLAKGVVHDKVDPRIEDVRYEKENNNSVSNMFIGNKLWSRYVPISPNNQYHVNFTKRCKQKIWMALTSFTFIIVWQKY